MESVNKNNPQVVVLGVGNILMGDEGIGVRAVEELEKRYEVPDNVEIVDGGTSGMSLINYMEGKDAVYIIDAIQKKGSSPGHVVVIDLLEKPNFYRIKISPHQLGISDLLHIMTISEILPKKIQLIGIVPKSLEPGLELSPEAKKGIEQALGVLIGILEGSNILIRKMY